MKAIRITALFAFLLVISCKQDEPEPINIIVNGDMESGSSVPDNWEFSGSQYEVGEWTDKVFLSATKSLRISGTAGNPQNNGIWKQQVCSNDPRGKTLLLKAMVKGNLTGSGVSLNILATDITGVPDAAVQFVTTMGVTPITGSFDWKEYRVEIGSVNQSVKCFWVSLIYLGNTSGEVYFDDVSLEIH